jgi:alpha-beta hydrolase superfamily lysophospholipase
MNTRAHNPTLDRQNRSTRNKLISENILMPDGCRLSALIGYPTSQPETGFRAVILVHGFAAEKTENGLFAEATRALLKNGYCVLAYDWRGLGDSDGDFSNSSLDTHISDFRNVLRWFSQKTKIETTQICAIAFSLGAVLVAKAVHSGDKLGGAVFWSPATRPSMHMWPRYSSREIRSKLNSHGFVIKPGTNVKLGRAILESLRDTDLGDMSFDLGLPLMICHGSSDSRIPVDSSRTSFEVAAKKNINNIVYAEFVGASHSFRPEKRCRTQLLQLLAQWLTNSEFRCGPPKKQVFARQGTVPHSEARNSNRPASQDHGAAEVAL